MQVVIECEAKGLSAERLQELFQEFVLAGLTRYGDKIMDDFLDKRPSNVEDILIADIRLNKVAVEL